jgi:N-acetylglutamate synthase-like GNAT family acetyltransferase
VKDQSELQVRQARFKDWWTLIPKLELIALFIIFIIAVPYALLLAFALFNANVLWLRVVGLGIIILLIPLPIWKFFSHFFQDWSCFWLAEQNDRVIAIAKVSRYHKYITLDKIRVKSKFRRQSIGSSLVKTLLEKEAKPAYSYIPAKALDFFSNIGFARISRKQISRNIKFEINKFNFSEFFYIAHDSSTTEESSPEFICELDIQSEDAIKKEIRKSYKSRPAKPEDLNQIRKLVSFSFDLFLPFGISSITIKKVSLNFYLILAIIFIFSGLSGIEGNIFIAFIYQLCNFILLLSIAIFPAILFTSICFGPRDWSKFWLIEYDGETVGYARVAKQRGRSLSKDYGVIQHIFVNEFHRHPSVEELLVARILKYSKGTFYISTSRERFEWLSRLGFEPINPNLLPSQYQLGGKVSALMKDVNLVFHKD